LAALVGIKDLRDAVLRDRPLGGPCAKAGVERVGELPGEDRSAVPVHDCAEVDEAALDRDICPLPRPGSAARLSSCAAGSGRPGSGVLPRGVRLLVDRLQAHLEHEPSHPLAVHGIALPPQPAGHLPRSEDRVRQVRLVDHPHQLEVLVRLRLGTMVVARPREPQELALHDDRQAGRFRLNHAAALLNARARQLFF
jgi:hypothetical protein